MGIAAEMRLRARCVRSGGFTLVEALVVSVIMAILAIVAVPMYTGYIKNQKRQAAASVAQTAAITAASLYRRNGAVPDDAALNAALSLPNAASYSVSVIAGTPNYVKVIEQSNPSDTAWAFAQF